MTGIIRELLRILGLVGTAPASYRDGGLFLADGVRCSSTPP